MKTLEQLSLEFQKRHAQTHSWRQVCEGYPIHPITASLIAQGGQPGNKIRARLGLPLLVPMEACPTHGVVHVRVSCPRPRQYRDLFSMPRKILLDRLINREVVNN